MPEEPSRNTKRSARWVIYVVMFATFAVLFGWAYLKPAASTKTAQASTESGLYEKYGFIVTSTPSRKDKVANFNPTLPNDDETVIAALRELMRTAYDEKVSDNVMPVVEDINEKNYVTFDFDGYKTYFQLFKNSKGELGSVSFWRDSNEKY